MTTGRSLIAWVAAIGCADPGGATLGRKLPDDPTQWVAPAPLPGPPRTLANPGRLVPPTPYGFWGLNGFVSPEGLADVHARMGVTLVQTATMNPKWAVDSLFPMAQEAGLQVALRLTGDHGGYTVDGNFDLGAWKVALSGWVDAGVGPFVENGTFAGHMLLDDIDTFEGRNPTAADLDEMARYSKEVIPGLMTFVRQRASSMPRSENGRYAYVDAVVNQYKANDGDVAAYVAREATAAEWLDVGIINGMNMADGGDGSSGQAGYRAGHFAMSADEILRYGTVLAQAPGCGMFLGWEYDAEERWADGSIGSTYFDRPEMQAALLELSKVVADHPRVGLLRE